MKWPKYAPILAFEDLDENPKEKLKNRNQHVNLSLNDISLKKKSIVQQQFERETKQNNKFRYLFKKGLEENLFSEIKRLSNEGSIQFQKACQRANRNHIQSYSKNLRTQNSRYTPDNDLRSIEHCLTQSMVDDENYSSIYSQIKPSHLLELELRKIQKNFKRNIDNNGSSQPQDQSSREIAKNSARKRDSVYLNYGNFLEASMVMHSENSQNLSMDNRLLEIQKGLTRPRYMSVLQKAVPGDVSQDYESKKSYSQSKTNLSSNGAANIADNELHRQRKERKQRQIDIINKNKSKIKMDSQNPQLQLLFKKICGNQNGFIRSTRMRQENLLNYLARRYGNNLATKIVNFLNMVDFFYYKDYCVIIDSLSQLDQKEILVFTFFLYDLNATGQLSLNDFFILWKHNPFNKMLQRDFQLIQNLCRNQLNSLKDFVKEQNYLEKSLLASPNISLNEYRTYITRGKVNVLPKIDQVCTIYSMSYQVIQHNTSQRELQKNIDKMIKRSKIEDFVQHPDFGYSPDSDSFTFSFDHFELIYSKSIPYIYMDILCALSLYQFPNVDYPYIPEDEFLFKSFEPEPVPNQEDQFNRFSINYLF